MARIQSVAGFFCLFVALAATIQGQTRRVSVNSAGAQGNAASTAASVSADGRYVAFVSDATNLVAGDTNAVNDVFVRDVRMGVTTRVSVDSAGNQGNLATPSPQPAISGDGRYVAFVSKANNLVAGDGNNVVDIFVHDRQTGATTRESVDSAGNEANAASWRPAISADGRYVAFVSSASNLAPGDTNGVSDIFVRDRQTGATTRVSIDSAANQGNGQSVDPWLSADGRYVAFASQASNLATGDSNGVFDVFVHDRQTGATTRVSVTSAGAQGNGDSSRASISADGRYVAFMSYATNLVTGDANGTADVFVHDRQTAQTTRVSVDSTGTEGNGESWAPSISGDGRFVAFHSLASNLVTGDANGVADIFVRDRQTGATSCASLVDYEPQPWANGASERAAVSADGRFLAFDSQATNLFGGDNNSAPDAFVTAVPRTQVRIDPDGESLSAGGSQQFSASVSRATSQVVTWGIHPPVGAVTTQGLYTAPSPIATPLLVTVNAQSAADPAATGAAWIRLGPGFGGFSLMNRFDSPFLDWPTSVTVVDQGTSEGPSNWQVIDRVLTQTSNIYGGSLDGFVLDKPGTYLATGDSWWTNYTVSTRLRSTDNDAIGIIFGYHDANNYYRFSMDAERSYRRLVKVVNGVFTVLAQDAVAYEVGRWYNVQATMARGIVQILVDGQELFNVQDASHSEGAIAFYSWNNTGAQFDDVAVVRRTTLGCVYTFNPASADVGPEASTAAVQVTTDDSCYREAVSNQSWLSVVGGATGWGSGTVWYSVEANTGSAREGVLRIENSTFTVRQAAAGAGGWFSDDFAGAWPGAWTVVDEGTTDKPSSWSVVSGVLQQMSNIYSGSPPALPLPGTYAYTGQSAWTNYKVTARMKSADNDAIGLMFGYKDANNYYRFSMDQTRTYRRLVKVVNGVWTQLVADTFTYVKNQWYTVEATLANGQIKIVFDGQPLFTVNDASHASGKIALYSWCNVGSYFDDVVVSAVVSTTTHCVNSAAGLHTALLTASSNGQHDVIRLMQGQYDGNFLYDSAEAFDLTIEGGYMATCASRVVDPANTVLDGMGLPPRVLKLTADQAADFALEGLTIENGGYGDEDTGGLWAKTTGNIDLRTIALKNNQGSGWWGGAGAYLQAQTVKVEDSIVDANYDSCGAAGMLIQSLAAELRRNDFRDNHLAGYYGYGGVSISCLDGNSCTGAATVTNNRFSGNQGVSGGGAGVDHDQVVIDGNVFVENQAESGGGVAAYGSSVTFTNNLVIGNHCWEGSGAGAYVGASANLRIVNNTIYGNRASYHGGGLTVEVPDGGTAWIYNNILVGNWAQDFWGNPDAEDLVIWNWAGSQVHLYNNDFDQSSGGTYLSLPFPIDPSNLNDVDPLFVDAANGNYRLSLPSPVINKGSNAAPNLPATDIEGNPRIQLGTVDMGAYEAAAMCTYSINPTQASVGASATTGSVQVTTQAGCPWTAASNNGWLHITGGASGLGNGTVQYSVDANPNTTSRQATATIAGQTFTLNQAGSVVCTYAINPTQVDVSASATTGSVAVNTLAGCPWTAVSNTAWLSITSGASGTGSGKVNYAVEANVDTASRQATAAIAGQTFTVNQAAGGTQPPLFTDTFSTAGPLPAAWTKVDQGTTDKPSNWSVASGALQQLSNIYGGTVGALPLPGTYVYAGQSTWSDYTVSVRMKSSDDDALGLMFGYKDANNYYRFSMDKTRNYRRLVKVVNGTWTQLAADAFAYAKNQWYTVAATLANGQIQITFDGQPLFTVNDSSHTTGRIALYTWCNAGSYFDDVVVTSVVGTVTHCVTSAAGLHTALLTAGGNGQHDVIRLVQGQYDGNFIYESTEAFDLTIEGGYTAGCASRVVDPANTALDGMQGQFMRVLRLNTEEEAGFFLEGLTIRNGGDYGDYEEGYPDSGGLWAWTGGDISLQRCVLRNNFGTGWGGAGAILHAQTVKVEDSVFDGNSEWDGTGGISIDALTAELRRNDIRNNHGIYHGSGGLIGGGAHVTTLVNNTFVANTLEEGPGAGAFQINNNGRVDIDGNVFKDNEAGGGWSIWVDGSEVSFTNNVAVKNRVEDGLALSASLNLHVVNNTIVENLVWRGALSVRAPEGSSAWIYNNVVLRNTSHDENQAEDLVISNEAGSQVYLYNNDFDQSPRGTHMDVTFPIDPSNLNDVDPLFVNAANGDYRLSLASPAINKGFNAAPNLPATDIDGNPRIQLGTVDMGAYEAAAMCTYSINPTQASVGASATTGSVQVTTQVGCPWTAGSNTAWLHITGGTSGLGNGTVQYSVDANPDTASRQGITIIDGLAFTLTQAGSVVCTYSINPTQVDVAASATTGSVAVTTLAGCPWTAVSNTAWLSITSGASGTGSGTVNYAVEANVDTASRQATAAIAGQTFTVNQAAGGAQPPLFSDTFSTAGPLPAAWTKVDQGTTDKPSSWSVASGALQQLSNIYGGTVGALPLPGTYVYAGQSTWSNYTVSVRMKSSDDDALGLMFGYKDANNYYRFSMDKTRTYRRLVKVVNGTWTKLAEDAFAYAKDQWYTVEATLSNGQIQITFDGQPLFTKTDASFTTGRIALYTWCNAGSYFDDVVVTAVAPISVTVNPPTATLSAGQSQAFTATVTGAANTAVTWSRTPAVGSITTAGLYTAPSLIASQTTVTVRATSVADPTKYGQATVTLLPSGGGGEIFRDEFTSGSMANWTVVDQGTTDKPSKWSVSNGMLHQTSNIWGGTVGALPLPGTFAYAGQSAWTNYAFSAKMRSADNDAIGLMFGYKDANNYYRFSMDTSRNYRRLVKVVNGVWTKLAEDAFAYAQNQWYTVEATMANGQIRIAFNGQPLFTVNDASHANGRIALYTWCNIGSDFDDVVVTAAP
ncbi:MAG: right-handed parallel beta-helix repeat-containing protein [Bryobacteraceae bacterium]|nr:right-handed parallel beta-helix repeat-containing protein [Bryobacteraceae bacterium]